MSPNRFVSRGAIRAAALLAVVGLSNAAHGYDVSAPVILQDFESTWQNITNRMPDIFAAGYGSVYTPPPGRAESGNQSVGYDAYDRFDLGSAGNPTLYGTASGLKQMVNTIHQMGGASYIDLVWNQSGFADTSTPGFAAAGGYPGFAMTLQTSNASSPGYNTGINAVDGDYHSSYAGGDQDERLAGLIDIAQDSNNVFIRQPTVAGPDNIPGPTPGASAWFYTGLANVPNPNNAQYYPDTSLNPISFYNPNTGVGNIKIYPYNLANPMDGTPVAENALGYLMRYTQYMVQVVGADGFRVDAAKNMPEWVMNYLDQATYRSSFRTLLNGQQENVFSFSEVYTSDFGTLQPYISKTINPNNIGTIGGNRDVLDFPLFFAMQQNLSGNGYQNDWRNMMNASIDVNDNGLMDGSQGVKFVSSQDNGPPALDNVAYAFTLMTPGNAIVYDNSHQFGTGRNFPQSGRSDALGGMYGNAIPTLVDLRNRYGRGNYIPETIDNGSGTYQYLQNEFAFERQGSCLVLLSNRTDAGYDTRTVHTDFPAGTMLVEQTGNATSTSADPTGDIPPLLVVNSDGTVNVKFLRNSAPGTSNFTDAGYLVYGLATPQGKMNISNVSMVLQSATPSSSNGSADAIAYANSTTVLASIDVIKTGSFQVQLNTNLVNLLGNSAYRDHDADGDNALFKIDDGTAVLNGDKSLDNTNPGGVAYGYQNFNTVHSPGYQANSGAGGNGSYAQTINTAQLGQGYHYISIMAFRHRDDGGPAVYSDWKQTIYVDLAPPNSAPSGFASTSYQTWTASVTSVDGLANSVHTLLDLPYNMTDAQVLADVSTSNQANQADVNLWQSTFSNLNSGNHTLTVVSYKPDGTYNIQRFSENQYSYLGVSNGNGSGLGDLNANGTVDQFDIGALIPVVESNNTQFNAAADINGDGSVDLADVFLLGPVLSSKSVSSATWTAYNNYIFGVTDHYVGTHTYTVVGTNVIYQDTAGTTNGTAGSSLNASYIRGTNLNVAAGAVVKIAANPTWGNGTSKISSLSVSGTTGAWTGKLDLSNNPIVVESTSGNAAADFARLTNMVLEGYDNGKWDGYGITSSTAAGDNSHLSALGIIRNKNAAGNAIYNTFGGQSADANAILIRYTYYGDANLSGKVDSADYTAIDNGFLQKLSGWANGDFNYDGVVNGSDYTLIDNAFNMQGAPLPSPTVQISGEIASPTAQIAESSSVPEPASLALLIAPVCGLLGTRVGRSARTSEVNS